MHVISRQVEEAVILDKNIKVTVVEVTDDYVVLGISEPRRPYREEVVYVSNASKECELLLN